MQITEQYLCSKLKEIRSQRDYLDVKEGELKDGYIETLPFKVNDCVRIKKANSGIEKCWIASIKVASTYFGCVHLDLNINKPKKNGERSHKCEGVYYITPDEVELI